MKKSQQIYLLILSLAGMFLAAVGFSYRGFFVPTYKTAFNIDNTQMGFIIGVSQLVTILFVYWGGRNCLRIGPKKILALGFFMNSISIFSITLVQSWIGLLIAYCGMASAMGLMVLGLNTLLPLITFISQTILMNFVHGIFGLGSTFIQKYLGWFLSNDHDWHVLFWCTSGFFLVGGILSYMAPGNPSDEHKVHRTTLIHRTLSSFLMLAVMFYVMSEFLLGSWVINFFQEGYGYSPSKAAFYSTLFYGTFTAGRLLGGFVLHRMNRFNGIITTLVIAALLIGISQLGTETLLICIGLSGLFFAIVYPTTMTLINETYGNNNGYFMGISAMVTAFGGAAGNLLFGYLNDHLGVQLTFNFIALTLILSAFSFIMAKREYDRIHTSSDNVYAVE